MGVPGGCFECPLQPSRTWKAALRGNQPVSRPRRSLSPRRTSALRTCQTCEHRANTSLFAPSRLTTDGAAGCRDAEMRQRNEAPQRVRRVELVEALRSEAEGGGSSSIPAERRVVSHTRVAAQDRVRPGAGDRRNRPPEQAVRSRTPRNRRAREAAVRRSLLVARSISGLDHGIRTRPGRRCTTGAAIQPGESQAGEGRGAGS